MKKFFNGILYLAATAGWIIMIGSFFVDAPK